MLIYIYYSNNDDIQTLVNNISHFRYISNFLQVILIQCIQIHGKYTESIVYTILCTKLLSYHLSLIIIIIITINSIINVHVHVFVHVLWMCD